ncbi:uncharacterized protein RCC_02494 [Ramularia collo-cygni]|uniref:FAM192A/Fyv6 N-terminal domain-containing protein n=1 Tax=Ramularia collo-cygni TaxID=112498 RepID=A0A2D3V594_9PEZI|nr:uncharacterized protein RCC_02494 [Ramularia collo-cygni]CZT16659.1 uncharacterized protein RCC_02494 [Ramularia collo-cygni]
MSRFVSGGTNEEPTERDEAWIAAQAEIEARRAEKSAQAQQSDGKSLYETLQANKAAKQDAFEESIKLRNQFQSLDEDDVEFLDSVLESTRAAEAAVKKQTQEQLDAFRRQREEAEQAARVAPEAEAPVMTESWTVSRKRKKGREDALGGIKLRKASSGAKAARSTEQIATVDERPAASPTANASYISPEPKTVATEDKPKAEEEPKDNSKLSPLPSAGISLGLDAYSSDEDD